MEVRSEDIGLKEILNPITGVLTELGTEALLRHEALVEYLARHGQLDRERFKAFRNGYVLEHWRRVTRRVGEMLRSEMDEAISRTNADQY